MRNELNLQDTILNTARQQGQMVTVILMNGFQMRGVIRGFDSYVVLLDSDAKQQMIFKHAISTIVPQHRIELFNRRDATLVEETEHRR